MEEKEIEELKEDIEKIKLRNRRVELDKKWETSILRKICICVLTYIVVLIYSSLINKNGNIFLNSAVPVIGFFLSTLSLDLIRKLWVKVVEKNGKI